MKRLPTMTTSLLRRRGLSSASPSSLALVFSQTRRTVQRGVGGEAALASSRCSHHFPSRRLPPFENKHVECFSSLAQDWDVEDDDDDDNVRRGGGGGGGGGEGSHRRRQSPTKILPTTHSRNLPPSVCPPWQLRSEVESIFDAPVGTLIVYAKPDAGGELKSVEEEISDAYYASDAAVQHVEYVMRGLNAAISDDSFVSRGMRSGAMKYHLDTENGENADAMARDDCFRAMLDLLERMVSEGEAYEELRTRVRSQLVNPSSLTDEGAEKASDSDEAEGENGDVDERDADKRFMEWEKKMEQSMSEAGFKTPASKDEKDEDGGEKVVSEELYQFGAEPGLTTHMFDLVLDALACLCQEQYGSKKGSSPAAVDLAELMPCEFSPPELAKEMLDTVLNRHWMDGGDIGLGGGWSDNPMNTVAKGIGVGAGTGAGNLANVSPLDVTFDVRSCPTPMTFNAVIRIAAEFDPAAHAEAVENAKVLSGAMGNASRLSSSGSGSSSGVEQEKERLRDVTIDAALSSYSRMQECAALTLRSLRASERRATSRGALKRQAKMLREHKTGKKNDNVISGRNSATYAYLIRTLTRCVPPSLSRGNMTFALYHKGTVQEGVLDERLVEAMRGVGGYDKDGEVLEDIEEGEKVPSPPISNGPVFDSILQKELGAGVRPALEKGRRLRHDRNYWMRRHVKWDDTY